MSDAGVIDTAPLILFPALRRSSYRRRLWLLAAGAALFLVIVAGFDAVRRASAPGPRTAGDTIALDFIAFYTGGHFVAEGRHRELFDLKAVKAFQDQIAAANGVDFGEAFGPWWNPPFYAWVFVPLSKLPFGIATSVWVGFNVLCAAVSCWLLIRMLPSGTGWRSYALVPVLMGLSVPFIHALSHGQNACTSLLIVTLAVTAWRADRPLIAGLVAGLMAYKPQHAVVLGGMLALATGWRAIAGLAMTGCTLLAVTLLTLPGALSAFLHQMPRNIRQVQEHGVYMWERHATLKAFWRLIVQGQEVGPPSLLTHLLTALCVAAIAVLLLRLTPAIKLLNPFDHTDRSAPLHRDRLIAATFLATPLVMPFYFDYDLLMLAVPAVLLASIQLRSAGTPSLPLGRLVTVAGPVAYAILLVNADIAERTRFIPVVPLLCTVFGAVAWPAKDQAVVEATDQASTDVPLARAA